MMSAASITLHQLVDRGGVTRSGIIKTENYSERNKTGWQIDYTGVEGKGDFSSEIIKRYEGIQEDFDFLVHHSCHFICICSVIEEMNGKPLDLFCVIRELRTKGLIEERGMPTESAVKILEMYTGKKWSVVVRPECPKKLKENDFVIEAWVVPYTVKPISETEALEIQPSLHARRVFKSGEKLDPSRHDRLLDEVGAIKVYMIYTCL